MLVLLTGCQHLVPPEHLSKAPQQRDHYGCRVYAETSVAPPNMLVLGSLSQGRGFSGGLSSGFSQGLMLSAIRQNNQTMKDLYMTWMCDRGYTKGVSREE